MYQIYYSCPDCGENWLEYYDCACDSECPACGAKNIQAEDFEEV